MRRYGIENENAAQSGSHCGNAILYFLTQLLSGQLEQYGEASAKLTRRTLFLVLESGNDCRRLVDARVGAIELDAPSF